MKCRLLFGTVGTIGLLLSAAAQTETALIDWDFEGEAALSVGYKDNILQSSVNEESSGFVRTALDASVLRFSSTGSFLMFYLFGEDTRYFDAPSVNYEQFISAIVSGAVPVGDDDTMGCSLSYLYMHQIYDASDTQGVPVRLLVLGHSLTFQPYWEHEYNQRWGHRFDLRAFQQFYEVNLDNYRELEGQFQLIRNYGHRSEISAGYYYMQRHYDTREQTDENGDAIPGSSLIYVQDKLAGECRHYFDENRYWRSLTQISGMINRDNDSGFFDYDRVLLRQQLRWDNNTWAVSGNGRLGWYWYKQQMAGNENRERSFVSLDLRVERRFGNHFSLFTEGEYEWNKSNDPLDEYNTWLIHTGVVLTM